MLVQGPLLSYVTETLVVILAIIGLEIVFLTLRLITSTEISLQHCLRW